MSNHGTTRTIKVDYLARVEGEGAMFLKIENDTLKDVKLKIFEPPRFFEALLRGREFTEAPDITARICGICPVAYQMSAVHAMEQACGVTVTGQLRALRRLLYCGEWIASQTLHIYMLHAPDFFDYPSAVEMAKDFPHDIERGLALKKVGNEIMKLVGGREIHPINVRVGGFYRTPTRAELEPLRVKLLLAKTRAEETVKWVSTFKFPDLTIDYTFVALRHGGEYPFNEGKIVSNKGLSINPSDFDGTFEEQHVEYSNALHCVMKGNKSSYYVGSMARYALNYDLLPLQVQDLARMAGLGPVCLNPFKSIIVRALEVLYACIEAIRIVDEYVAPEEPAIQVRPRAATGYAATEAPRGLLYNRYTIDNSGVINDALIIPPTSQNQKQIESDLWNIVAAHITADNTSLRLLAEQAIRNYDPCISCATHFLKLEIDRSCVG
jgi:sulfhydrogenase subunit alpha